MSDQSEQHLIGEHGPEAIVTNCPGCGWPLDVTCAEGVLHLGRGLTLQVTSEGWIPWHEECFARKADLNPPTPSQRLGAAWRDYVDAILRPLEPVVAWLANRKDHHHG